MSATPLEIEIQLQRLEDSPELLERLDRRTRYEVRNRKTRNLSLPRMLEILYTVDLLIIPQYGTTTEET